jgi:hypothetical protein
MRYAIITRSQSGYPAPEVVAVYLPSRYAVTGHTSTHVYISGEDNAGWTLDDYVIPRLMSGMIHVREVPAMTNDAATVILDFVNEGGVLADIEGGEDNGLGEVTCDVRDWHGPGGGNPEVEVTGPRPAVLDWLLRHYTAGDMTEALMYLNME